LSDFAIDQSLKRLLGNCRCCHQNGEQQSEEQGLFS
jgi:hypothetical protein